MSQRWHRLLQVVAVCGRYESFMNHASVSFGPIFVPSGQKAVITAPSRGVRRDTSIGRLKFGHRYA